MLLDVNLLSFGFGSERLNDGEDGRNEPAACGPFTRGSRVVWLVADRGCFSTDLLGSSYLEYPLTACRSVQRDALVTRVVFDLCQQVGFVSNGWLKY